MKRLLILMLLLGLAAPLVASETNYNAGADGNSDVTWANCSAAIMLEACAAAEATTSVAPVASSTWIWLIGIGVGLGVASLRRKPGA